MKHLTALATLLLFLLLGPACGRGTDPAPAPDAAPAPQAAPAPAPSPTDGVCCDVDDVLLMQALGISDAAKIRAIETDTLEVAVAPEDVVRLQEAQVAQPVIDALVGREEPPRAARTPAPEVPPLDVSITYTAGARAFVLNNHSGRQYTGLVLTANDAYVYRLKRLPVGAEDSIRLASFVSRSSGEELKASDGLRSLHIKADQGVWTKRF
jgi:hypothetical protein